MIGGDEKSALRRQEARALATPHERPPDAKPIDRPVDDRRVEPRNKGGLRFGQQQWYNVSPVNEYIRQANVLRKALGTPMSSPSNRRMR